MKKIGTLFTLLCVMNFLAIVGLVAYLFGTGRLDKQKFGAIVTLVRHQGEPEKFNEKLYDILEPAPATASATAPASQPAMADLSLGISSQDRLAIASETMQRERTRLDSLAQELRHRQELLAKLQEDVDARLKKIDTQKKAFEAQVAAAQKKSVDDDFQKTLDLYNELKAKQVKDLFLGLKPELAASYLQSMDASRAGEIIGEFKSPAETAFIQDVLERIRTAGTSAASGDLAAGK
ncbi:MAG TPA: hypothetical protein VM008_17870 [Phycisphaerae bacterium]|nr:hypothetical protein [Phycisphaerae bacterium]